MRLADGGSRLCIAVGTGGAVEVIEEAVPFVQRLLAEKELTANDCRAWRDDGNRFDWRDIEMMLTKLENDGLIEEVPAGKSGAP